jgi:hypothetical protein
MATMIDDSQTAEIVITRDAENDIKMRGLEIFVDGEYAYDLMYNSSFDLKLTPGAHKIKVSNHLYTKTLALDLKAGDKINLLAGNNFGILGGIMVSVLGMGPYKVFLRPDTRVPNERN